MAGDGIASQGGDLTRGWIGTIWIAIIHENYVDSPRFMIYIIGTKSRNKLTLKLSLDNWVFEGGETGLFGLTAN